MPEGHLIHRFARDHAAALAGQRVAVSSPQGRFAREASMLDGRHLMDVDAWGKHLFYSFDRGAVVHVHLGMRGLFLRAPSPAPEPRASVRMRLVGARDTVDLIAPTACEVLDDAERAAIIARLGPDPLREEADLDAVRAALARSTRAIGAMLLDQEVIAGLGNVLRAEILNMVRIAPEQPSNSLTAEQVDALLETTVSVMREACGRGRIITRVPPGADPSTVPEDEGRFVYKQQQCRRCGNDVQTATIAARTAYRCPNCQPLRATPR